MSTRTVFLIIYPGQAGQRAHFGIWVPYAEGGAEGNVIHVVGLPMVGFSLEFKRKYNPAETARRTELVPIGSVDAQHVHIFGGQRGKDSTPRGNLELVAAQVQPPGASANFLAPVNDTTNRRCQEWTMDYVRRLVAVRYLDEAAVAIVQSKRDAPNVGIGLRSAAAPPQQAQATPQQGQQQTQQQQGQQQQGQQQATAAANVWVWDPEYSRNRRWDGGKWVWQE
ncbi:Nn.00g094810.m01.CDS01 [Neocucurbitaria sp. VM-36]